MQDLSEVYDINEWKNLWEISDTWIVSSWLWHLDFEIKSKVDNLFLVDDKDSWMTTLVPAYENPELFIQLQDYINRHLRVVWEIKEDELVWPSQISCLILKEDTNMASFKFNNKVHAFMLPKNNVIDYFTKNTIN